MIVELEETAPLETCREWDDWRADHCHQPAMLIFWGKLFPAEALGPRCEQHAATHLPDLSSRTITQSAVFDLRGLVRQ